MHCAGLALSLAVCANGKRFMEVTSGRRKLAAASVPAASSQNFCQQEAYLTDDPTSDAIFDQLTPDEYLSVAQHLVGRLGYASSSHYRIVY